MHLQILASGSKGNSVLVRAGAEHLLVDAGLTARELCARLEDGARVVPRSVGHVCLTHGHLDHARGAGAFARRTGAVLHCCERLMGNASVRGTPRLAAIGIGPPIRPAVDGGGDGLELRAVRLPHDAEPTVAFRIEHGGRVAAVVTDMGRPDAEAARRLAGAHVLVLEFNHDRRMLEEGPYPFALKRRIAGDEGHLSNDQAREVLRRVAGPELHTLVVAHLSETNNEPERALDAARAELEALGLGGVRVLAASQSQVGPNLAV